LFERQSFLVAEEGFIIRKNQKKLTFEIIFGTMVLRGGGK